MGSIGFACTKRKSNMDTKTRPQRQSNPSVYFDRLTEFQVSLLKEEYKNFQLKGGIDFKDFRLLFPSITTLPEGLDWAAFCIFDTDKSRKISWHQLCLGISKFLLGEKAEKALFVFSLFDSEHSGLLTTKRIKQLKKFTRGCLKRHGSFRALEEHLTMKLPLSLESFAEWATCNLNLNQLMKPFELIPLPQTEKTTMKRLTVDHSALVLGELWYVISRDWMEAWRAYVDYFLEEQEATERRNLISGQQSRSVILGQKPIEIDNSFLASVDCELALREDLEEHLDYELVHHSVWHCLKNWYGGGPEYPREVVTGPGGSCVDLYPVVFKVLAKISGETLPPTVLCFHGHRTVQELIESLRNSYGNESIDKLYLFHGDYYKQLASDWTVKSLRQEGLVTVAFSCEPSEEETFPVEVLSRDSFSIGETVEINENGAWLPFSISNSTPLGYSVTSLRSSKSLLIAREAKDMIRRPARVPLEEGKASGILNLGNTCYMNAVLQCLSRTPLLSSFFSEGRFTKELNKENPNSSRGVISAEVAKIFRALADPTEDCVPVDFKKEFTDRYSDFRGNGQQDSHEFLRVLMDFLHEDLSRVKDNENCANTISLNNPEPELEVKASKEQWRNIQGNTGSVISDFCGGQTRRKLHCARCGDATVVFEPFMDLSVPVPAKDYDFRLKVKFVPRGSGEFKKFKFGLDESTDFEDLLSKIHRATGLTVRNLLFAHIKDSRIVKLLHSAMSVKDIIPRHKKKLYVYEIISSINEGEADGKNTVSPVNDPDWRDSLKEDQFVDVKYRNEWVEARVNWKYGEELRVFVYTGRGTEVTIRKNDTNLAQFRSHTGNEDEILHIPLLMSLTNNRLIGDPLLISIGNWYTWKDLYRQIEAKCKVHARGLTKSKLSTYINVHVLTENYECGLCEDRTCQGCHMPNKKYDKLTWFTERTAYILIEWKTAHHYMKKWPAPIRDIESFEIFDCLQEYIKEETLETDCSNCGHNQMKLQCEIWRVPDILIIHFKRFNYKDKRMKKLDNLINFPLKQLDISAWMLSTEKKAGITVMTDKDNHMYELFGVVNHTGGSTGGHYESVTLHTEEDGPHVWLEYDDEKVYRLAGPTEVVSSKAYILFYRRRRFASSNVINMSL